MLVGELYRWGIPLAQLEPLLPHADRALDWVDEYGDADGDGFVEYERATEAGLVNQGWKDSFDGITFPSGALPHAPIALAEVQGYVYGALRARADLAEALGDHERARRLTDRAADLKLRFNERFWLPHRGYYALALDAEKQPVESLASNMGHCLWTGIIDEQHAPAVAEALLSPEMFAGFGVRTLASSMGAYNPMSYHNGSVWPHDNALIAAGLRRYGFAEEADRIVLGLISAAEGFGGRLPELFCGFGREEFERPVPYPTACAPQAWAAATPLFLLRVLLGLEPDVPAGVVEVSPAPPEGLLPLRVDQLHLAGSTLGLDVTAESWQARGGPDGVRTVWGTPPWPPANGRHRQPPPRGYRDFRGHHPTPPVLPRRSACRSSRQPRTSRSRVRCASRWSHRPYFTVPPEGYGGVESVVAGLVDGLVERGHHVTLLGAGEHGTRAQRFVGLGTTCRPHRSGSPCRRPSMRPGSAPSSGPVPTSTSSTTTR